MDRHNARDLIPEALRCLKWEEADEDFYRNAEDGLVMLVCVVSEDCLGGLDIVFGRVRNDEDGRCFDDASGVPAWYLEDIDIYVRL